MGLSGAVSLISYAGWYRDALYAVHVGSPVVFGFSLLLEHLLVGSSLCLQTESLNPYHVLYVVVEVLTKQNPQKKKYSYFSSFCALTVIFISFAHLIFFFFLIIFLLSFHFY